MINIEAININKFDEQSLLSINEIIDESGDSTIFQTPEWITIIDSVIDLDLNIGLVFDDKKAIAYYPYFSSNRYGILLNTYSPYHRKTYTLYGGPIIRDNYKQHSIRIIGKLLEQKKNSLMSYQRIQSRSSSIIDSLSKLNFETSERPTAVIDLRLDKEELWKRLKRNTRKKIIKSQKSNLEIFHDIEGTYIDEYLELLDNTLPEDMHRPNKQFFHRIIKNLSLKDQVYFTVAKHDNEIIAGAIHLILKNWTYSWNSASNEIGRKFAANPYLKWDFMCWAKNRGLEYYDLMDISRTSARTYKMGFGGKEVPYYSLTKKSRLYRLVSTFRW